VRAAWIRAQRDTEVREAAQAWRSRGAIDPAALAAIEAQYPAVWPNPSWIWGVLGFVFVTFALGGLFAALQLTFHAVAMTALVMALALAFAADRFRPSASGPSSAAGGAAAFWCVWCLLVAVGSWVAWGEHAWTPLLAVGTLAWGLAAWRWGYPAFALFGAAFFFLLLARFPSGRMLWVLAGAALCAAASRLQDSVRLAPSHRRCAAAALTASLAAVYLAVNRYSVDYGFVETLSGRHGPWSPSRLAQAGASIATALLPVLVVAWGIRARRTLLLGIGAVFCGLSVATLHEYVRLGPPWAVLTEAGALTIGIALGLHRWLRRAPGRQRRGFTADILFEDESRQQALGVAATALTLAPEAASPAPAPQPGAFRGGGGASGGGGSSGTF
jgi:hypothetical protein